MIHPDTTIQRVDDVIGNGVFATALIPRGTIVVVRDAFDLSIGREVFYRLPERQLAAMERYAFFDKRGDLLLSWDHAKYMNHRCTCNTMMTDYDVEIAIADIEAGEEITTEYGLLNLQEAFDIACGCRDCRRRLDVTDIDRYADRWDARVKQSLLAIFDHPQLLLEVLDEKTVAALRELRENPASYRSVKNLKWRR